MSVTVCDIYLGMTNIYRHILTDLLGQKKEEGETGSGFHLPESVNILTIST